MIGYYYYHVPAKTVNVLVQSGAEQSNQPPKKILVAEKEFAEGDVIYKASAHATKPPYPR